jgi:hypothetical protein
MDQETNTSGLDTFCFLFSIQPKIQECCKTLYCPHLTQDSIEVGSVSAFSIDAFLVKNSRPGSKDVSVERAEKLFGYPRDTHATFVPFCCL